MDMTPEQYEKMLAFFEARMDQSEMESWIGELNANPELKEQFEFERLLYITQIDTLENENLDGVTVDIALPPGSVSDHDQEAKSSDVKVKPITRTRTWWAVAATVIALATIWLVNEIRKPKIPGIVIIQPKGDSGKSKIFKEYYEKYPSYTQEFPELHMAMAAYDQNDYPKTIRELDDVPILKGGDNLKHEKKDGIILFYKGLSMLEINQAKNAIELMNASIKKLAGDKKMLDDVNWYKSLALIKDGRKEEAVPLLNDLKNSSLYSAKAVRLLQSINP